MDILSANMSAAINNEMRFLISSHLFSPPFSLFQKKHRPTSPLTGSLL
jgi:hypothetical protein